MINFHNFKDTKFKIGVVVFCLLGMGAFYIFDKNINKYEEPLISDEMNKYLVLEFIPKYKFSDCTVRFSVRLNDKKLDYNRMLIDTTLWFLSKHEPKIGFIDINNINQSENFLFFADQCDRKEEIFQHLATYIDNRFGSDFTVKKTPDDQPIETQVNFLIKSYGQFWTDSPDYEPNYWPTYHKAMRGDGVALYAMVDLQDADEHQSRYLFMSLAEAFLPKGTLKDKAHNEKEGIFKDLYPDQKKSIEQVIKNWKQKIEKYQLE